MTATTDAEQTLPLAIWSESLSFHGQRTDELAKVNQMSQYRYLSFRPRMCGCGERLAYYPCREDLLSERFDFGKGRLGTTEQTVIRYFTERFYGSFERQIPLENVEQDKVKADFRNGLLTVTLPKSTPSSQNVKRIAVNAS